MKPEGLRLLAQPDYPDAEYDRQRDSDMRALPLEDMWPRPQLRFRTSAMALDEAAKLFALEVWCLAYDRYDDGLEVRKRAIECMKEAASLWLQESLEAIQGEWPVLCNGEQAYSRRYGPELVK